MSRSFMTFAGHSTSRSLSIQRLDDDPECFGIMWDPDDEACRDRCSVFHRCGKETERLKQVREAQASITPSTSVHSRVSTHSNLTQSSGIVRPKTPDGFPPGTEYLPPEEAGQHGPIRRGAAIAIAEGTAAGIGQFFNSLASFAKDTTAWHPHAGRWRYGEKYGPQKQPKEPPRMAPKSPPKSPKS